MYQKYEMYLQVDKCVEIFWTGLSCSLTRTNLTSLMSSKMQFRYQDQSQIKDLKMVFNSEFVFLRRLYSFQAIRKNEDKIRIVLNKVRFPFNNTSKKDVAPWCYWIGLGWDLISGRGEVQSTQGAKKRFVKEFEC